MIQTWSRCFRIALPAIVLASIVLLPHLGKAFTIDDTVFLREAMHALVDPIHPAAFSMVWNDRLEPATAFVASGPGMGWVLLPAAALGGSESIAHGTQLVLLALALVVFVRLSLRIGFSDEESRWGALLFASAPVVLGMASTAMPDIPATAFGLIGLERLLAFQADRRAHQALASIGGFVFASLTRSHLLIFFAVAILALVRDVEFRGLPRALRRELAPLLVLVVAVVSLGLLFRWTADPAFVGPGLASATRRYLSLANVRANGVASCLHFVFALPWAIPWIALRGFSAVFGPISRFLPLAAMLALVGVRHDSWMLVGWMAGIGAAALVDLVRESWRRNDGVSRFLTAGMFVALPVIPYTHFPSKYLVASAPFAALLLVREMRAASPARLRWRPALVAAGALLGLLIVRGDSAFAGLGRRAAAELVAPRVAQGERVWFAGHWGFQWYAERAGARPLTVHAPRPVPGDVVVAHPLSDYGQVLTSIERLRRVETLTESSPGGRVMNRSLCAGFFASSWGLLPWAFGWNELDRYEVWVVK